jgi:hypothetical protein
MPYSSGSQTFSSATTDIKTLFHTIHHFKFKKYTQQYLPSRKDIAEKDSSHRYDMPKRNTEIATPESFTYLFWI